MNTYTAREGEVAEYGREGESSVVAGEAGRYARAGWRLRELHRGSPAPASRPSFYAPLPPPAQVFKTSLEYWNFFVPEIYSSSCAVETAMVFSFAPQVCIGGVGSTDP